jgi:hypothetical protein
MSPTNSVSSKASKTGLKNVSPTERHGGITKSKKGLL